MNPSPQQPFRLGTRASPLALRQAEMARDALIAAHGWAADAVTLVPMIASGDRIQDRALADVGGKALWTKELDIALVDGVVDAAVHSMKDVETIRPTAFVVAAMLPRADVRDRLLGAVSIDALPQGARVGTSSPRRTAQLLALRPDLGILLFRGNVATRLRKLDDGQADATILAAAGLDRLGLGDIGAAIPATQMLPAPSQGAIGIEVLAERSDVRAFVSAINDAPTCQAVDAERAFLAAIGADCQSPVAAYAAWDGNQLVLTAELLSSDGREKVAGQLALFGDDTPETLAQQLLDRASPAIRALFAG